MSLGPRSMQQTCSKMLAIVATSCEGETPRHRFANPPACIANPCDPHPAPPRSPPEPKVRGCNIDGTASEIWKETRNPARASRLFLLRSGAAPWEVAISCRRNGL
jgi:hypothetical protein